MLGLLPLVVLLPTSALAHLVDRQNKYEPAPGPEYVREFLYDCDKAEKTIEAGAWKDHLWIAKEALKWKPGKRWQPAFDLYMGTDSKYKPWSESIKKAQKNQVKVHSSNWIWPDSWLYIYCKEKSGKPPYKKTESYCSLSTYAYSFIVKGWFHNSYNIVFCPKYYQEKMLADQIINNVKSGNHDKKDALYLWKAYGQTYYHELMHMPGLVNETEYEGRMPDIIKPYQLRLVAKNQGCKGSWFTPGRGTGFYASSMYAPDSYATAGTMAFFQEQLKLGDVPTVDATDGGLDLDGLGGDSYKRLPDLDSRSSDYESADLQYDATKEDWSFKGLGLQVDNLPLLYPDSGITEDEYNQLAAEADQPGNESETTDDKAEVKCGPIINNGGSVEVINQNVADFCKRDLSVNQQAAFTGTGTQ